MITDVKRHVPDDILNVLLQSAQKLSSDVSNETCSSIQAKFNQGLQLIECGQHSVAGGDYNSFTGRIFSKATHTLSVGKPELSPINIASPPHTIYTNDDVQQGLLFAKDFLKKATNEELKVAATDVPLISTPEGLDAVRHMEGWIKNAEEFLMLRQQVKVFTIYLTALSMRLGFPEIQATE